MDYMVTTYAMYTAAAVMLTGVLTRTLFRNGKVFLEDVFADQPGLADAVNRLLVVGFSMLQLGYAFMIARTDRADTVLEATENLMNSLGVLLLSLGILHFANVLVFWRMRRRGRERTGAIAPDPNPPLPPPPPPAVAAQPA